MTDFGKETRADGADRPHCLQRADCKAKTPGRHCLKCSANTPEARRARSEQATHRYTDPMERQRMSEVKKIALQDPEKRARVIGGVREMIKTRKVYRGHATGLTEAERALYRKLLRQQKYPAPEARALVDDQRRHEARRTITRITNEMHAKQAREKAQAY